MRRRDGLSRHAFTAAARLPIRLRGHLRRQLIFFAAKKATALRLVAMAEEVALDSPIDGAG